MNEQVMEQVATREGLQRLLTTGILSPDEFEQALRVAGIMPDGKAWGRFLGKLFLILGAVFLAAGVIFFFAYNWASMPKSLKFIIVQTAMLIAAVIASFIGLDRLAAKVSLLLSSILVGALLALYGQTYQTGADAYELFMGWSAFIAGWVIISNFAPLWLLLLLLLQTTLFLYWAQVVEMSWFMYRSFVLYELLFGMNVLALGLWELFSSRGVSWLSGRWIPRLVANIGLLFLVIPLVILIEDHHGFSESKYNALVPVLYFAAVGFALWFYRTKIFDLYLLSSVLLSVIVLVTIFFAKQIGSNYGGFLVLSIVIIAMSAGAAAWLRLISRGRSTEVV